MLPTAEALFQSGYKHWKQRIASGEQSPLTMAQIEQERALVQTQLAPLDSRICDLRQEHAAAEQVFLDEVWRRLAWWRRLFARPPKHRLLAIGRKRTPDSLKRLESEIYELCVEALPLRRRIEELEREESFVHALAEETQRDAARQKQITEQRERLEQRKAARETQRKESDAKQQFIRDVAARFDRHQFLIRNKDYKRGNRLDNLVRRELLDKVLAAFNQRCVLCGSSSLLVLDHYGIPKNEGGNFILYDNVARSYKLNVAVLCQSCNSTKGERPPYELLSRVQVEEVERIHALLLPMLLSIPAVRRTLVKWYEIDLLGNFQAALDQG